MMQLRRTCFIRFNRPNVHELWFLHALLDFILYFCLKNAMNFNVVIVSFLPSDHRNDPDLLVFAVSCLSFFDANGTQLFFDFSVLFLHTNLWYRFELWYTSTLCVHVHNFCNWSYIFHVQILGTCSTDRLFYREIYIRYF